MLNWENLSYSINLDQLWKLDSTEKLISKGKVWQSDDKWKLLCKLDSTMCYIENHSIYMVLETTFHEKVIEEDLIKKNQNNCGKDVLIGTMMKATSQTISHSEILKHQI